MSRTIGWTLYAIVLIALFRVVYRSACLADRQDAALHAANED